MVIEIISGFWITNNGKKAFWPPSAAELAVENRDEPNKDWQLFEIDEILAAEGNIFIYCDIIYKQHIK